MVANVIQNPFSNEISFFGNFDGTHVPKKENLMVAHMVQTSFWKYFQL